MLVLFLFHCLGDMTKPDESSECARGPTTASFFLTVKEEEEERKIETSWSSHGAND
jgi:hypothetical protein